MEWKFEGINLLRSILLQGSPAGVFTLLDSYEVVAVAPTSSIDELLASLGHVVEVIARIVAATRSWLPGLVAHRVHCPDSSDELAPVKVIIFPRWVDVRRRIRCRTWSVDARSFVFSLSCKRRVYPRCSSTAWG